MRKRTINGTPVQSRADFPTIVKIDYPSGSAGVGSTDELIVYDSGMFGEWDVFLPLNRVSKSFEWSSATVEMPIERAECNSYQRAIA
ncbi:hypothetical protein [Marinobacterium sp. BA1]|uniref:hypothetical protein n=1 Tax=Marinobacterium sp. BA1 TaxID=3138931 RepID=UPI0032E63518